MGKNKPSFFERLTGAVNVDEENQADDASGTGEDGEKKDWLQEEAEDAQLAVDIYQTPTHIVLQTMVAGVRPDDLDISITREMVSISGRREGPRNVNQEDWFTQELYWGNFSRTITLPQEIETEEAEALENHGLLIIKMPKIDREKKMKIKVQSR